MFTLLTLNETNDTLFEVFLVAGIIYFAIGIIAFIVGRPWVSRP